MTAVLSPATTPPVTIDIVEAYSRGGSLDAIPVALVSDPVPDPFVVRVPETGELWMAGTTNETKATFLLYKSIDGGHRWHAALSDNGEHLAIFPADARPAWIHRRRPDRWAPEIHRVRDQWLCLYTARHIDGDLRVAAAVAKDIAGPWRDLGPILQKEHGVIDATMTIDPRTNELLMLYKVDSNSVGLDTPILARTFRLDDAGLELLGDEVELMRSGPLDGGLIEGPFVIHENGTSYVLVSSDYFGDARYKTWVTRVDDFRSPAAPRRLLLSSDSPCLAGAWVGPGHVSAVRESDGVYALYFHAWAVGQDGKAEFGKRFRRGEEQRKALRVTLRFRDENGAPVEPYIVEDTVAKPQLIGQAIAQ